MVLISTESSKYEESYDRMKWTAQNRQNLSVNLIVLATT